MTVDLHCDLLGYLLDEKSDPFSKEDIGCSLPHLITGKVSLQIMAIFAATEAVSVEEGLKQALIFKNLLHDYSDQLYHFKKSDVLNKNKIAVVAAIENASAFCLEDEPLSSGFKNLEQIISDAGPLFYIGMTHHLENRFGGGNSTNIGLKKDGEALLRWMQGKKIALDLSHTSDALAYDCLIYIDKQDLGIPVIASHSNFRNVFKHPRNLPDDIAKEIIKRKGLIGINFLRAFLDNKNDQAIYDHIQYGLELGAQDALCFGADFFFTGHHPDQSRRPFYYKEQENASCYPAIIEKLRTKTDEPTVEKIANENALSFIQRLWS